MKKYLAIFTVLIALIGIGLTACTPPISDTSTPATCTVYNNLYYSTVEVSLDGVSQGFLIPGNNGVIHNISVGNHTLYAVTVSGPIPGSSVTRSVHFNSGDNLTWTLSNSGSGITLSMK